MAHPAPDAPAGIELATSRPMTRCECAGTPFAEIARRLREEGATLDEICGRTGCGQTCTACLPDLELYLGGRV